MNVFIEGQEISGFKEISVSRDLDNFCGQFNITLTSGLNKPFPVKRQAEIEIKTAGFPLLKGYVEKINVGYSQDSHDIMIQGRDITCDIIDTTTDGSFEFNPPTNLVSIIEEILAYHKIEDILVENEVNNLKNFVTGDIIAGELGTSLFSVIESYCRLRQVLPITSEEGNIILLQTSSPENSGASISHLIGEAGALNNVLSAGASYDDSDRYSEYNAYGQGNVSALSGASQNPADVSSRKGNIADTKVRAGRQLNFQAERASSAKDLADRALWEANIRRARSAEYKPKVQGHLKGPGLGPWKLHEVSQVVDEFADIKAAMLCKAVEFNFSESSGSTTSLVFVVKDAYSLQAEQDEREAKANKQGDSLE